ncbi:MAG: hypothetical protein KDC80_05835 [Saprospiraceae bacterium]|nr:hypothetical protein [Saprospiraceae bacterium]
MNEELEKIVRENQERFDQIELVSEDRIWMGINDQLSENKNKGSNKFWIAAAASIIFILSATVLYLTIQINRNDLMNPDHFIAETYPELKKEFDQYNQQIHARKTALSFDTISPEEFPELFEEMQILGNNYQTAINDLQNMGKDEAIVRVLMRYHQRQLDLLERLSNEIDKKKLYYEKNNQHSIY